MGIGFGLLYVCTLVGAGCVGYFGVKWVQKHENTQTSLSIPSMAGDGVPRGGGVVAWRERQHQKARCEELLVWTCVTFLVFFWGGFIHLYSTRHYELLAGLAAARAMECPYHCDCGEGIRQHPAELTSAEALYYATIGPTHTEECKRHLASLDAWPWPNPFHLLREYILENATALFTTLGACVAGFIMQFPVMLQMWITTLLALCSVMILTGAATQVPLMLPRGWTPRRITQAPKSFVTVEDITEEEEGRTLRLAEIERP